MRLLLVVAVAVAVAAAAAAVAAVVASLSSLIVSTTPGISNLSSHEKCK